LTTEEAIPTDVKQLSYGYFRQKRSLFAGNTDVDDLVGDVVIALLEAQCLSETAPERIRVAQTSLQRRWRYAVRCRRSATAHRRKYPSRTVVSFCGALRARILVRDACTVLQNTTVTTDSARRVRDGLIEIIASPSDYTRWLATRTGRASSISITSLSEYLGARRCHVQTFIHKVRAQIMEVL